MLRVVCHRCVVLIVAGKIRISSDEDCISTRSSTSAQRNVYGHIFSSMKNSDIQFSHLCAACSPVVSMPYVVEDVVIDIVRSPFLWATWVISSLGREPDACPRETGKKQHGFFMVHDDRQDDPD